MSATKRWLMPCMRCGDFALMYLGESPLDIPDGLLSTTRPRDHLRHTDGRELSPSDKVICDNCKVSLIRVGVRHYTFWRMLPDDQLPPVFGSSVDARDVQAVRQALGI